MAFVSGTLIGWTVENMPIESLSVGAWVRSLAWAAVALMAPVAGAAAVISGMTMPSFDSILGRKAQRPRQPLALLLGALVIALAVLAMQAALGLDFDPRYRDFPFAPLSGGAFPLLVVSVWRHRHLVTGHSQKAATQLVSNETEIPARSARSGRYAMAEVATAAMLGLSAIYIVFNETLANWQALWFCAGLIALAVTLLRRVPDAPG
jgi:hypothetical protein